MTPPRTPIVRSEGTTPSERKLTALGDRTFLKLWSYANPYRDQGQRAGGKGDGKELCDLLVVCGRDILLFSDKDVRLEANQDSMDLAWSRWFKKAVLKSAEQLRGADRWIRDFPSRIFLDRACTRPLELELPAPSERRVHRIVVAGGAKAACRQFFGGGSGTLMIAPILVGDAHVNPSAAEYAPFAVGDIDPGKPFVHVFDEVTLELLLTELDTMTDLVEYLVRKERLIRSGRLVSAGGEEELLAYYLHQTDDMGHHDFIPPESESGPFEVSRFSLDGGLWERSRMDPQFLARKTADRISYFWDELIGKFTQHILDGTSLSPLGPFDLKVAEASLRTMALEPRFRRRVYAHALLEAIKLAPSDDVSNRVLAGLNDDLAYVFVQFPYRDFMKPDREMYRQVRLRYLVAYCMRTFARMPRVRRIVGIACEPPRHEINASEDVIYVERPESEEALISEVDEFGKHVEFGPQKVGRFDALEYPRVAPEQGPPGRPAPVVVRSKENKPAKRRKRRLARAARRKNRGS